MASRKGRMMRIAIGQFNELTEEKLRFAAQIGVTGVQMNTPKLPGDTHWETADLRRLYPAWDCFQAVRQALDPTGLFLNPYLRTLFGVRAPDPT